MERKHCKHNKSKQCIHKRIKAIQHELNYFKYKIKQLPKIGPQGPSGIIGQQGISGFQGPQGFQGSGIRPPMSTPPPQNNLIFILESKSVIVPPNVIKMTVSGIGGGGGGGYGGRSGAGGGGSSGEIVIKDTRFVSSELQLDIIIGKGGIGSYNLGSPGSNGEPTTLSIQGQEIFNLKGGIGGKSANIGDGGGGTQTDGSIIPPVAYGGGGGKMGISGIGGNGIIQDGYSASNGGNGGGPFGGKGADVEVDGGGGGGGGSGFDISLIGITDSIIGQGGKGGDGGSIRYPANNPGYGYGTYGGGGGGGRYVDNNASPQGGNGGNGLMIIEWIMGPTQ